MAIKYTRSREEGEDRSQGSARFARYSASPPTRRALTWIIVGTALVVTLLMVTSEFTSRPPAEEYVWVQGTAISNETDDESVLRVELEPEGDEPPHVYEISKAGQEGLDAIAPGDAVRMQVELDDAGNVASIIRVERVVPEGQSSQE